MKLAKLVEAGNPDVDIKKVKRDTIGAFVTLLQMMDGLKNHGFNTGQSDIYKQAGDLKTEVSTLYKRMEAVLRKVR